MQRCYTALFLRMMYRWFPKSRNLNDFSISSTSAIQFTTLAFSTCIYYCYMATLVEAEVPHIQCPFPQTISASGAYLLNILDALAHAAHSIMSVDESLG